MYALSTVKEDSDSEAKTNSDEDEDEDSDENEYDDCGLRQGKHQCATMCICSS